MRYGNVGFLSRLLSGIEMTGVDRNDGLGVAPVVEGLFVDFRKREA
jgi:hypothetical protein